MPEVFANNSPEDKPEPAKKFKLVFENDRWKTVNQSASKKFTAKGLHIFVVQMGQLVIARRSIPCGGQ